MGDDSTVKGQRPGRVAPLDLDLRRLLTELSHPHRLLDDPRTRPSQARASRQRQAEQHERTGLVRCGEVDRDEVQQRRDAERDLEERHVHRALDQAVGRRRQLGADMRPARVQEERDDRGEGRVGLCEAGESASIYSQWKEARAYEHPVVELDRRGVLKDVAPPVRLVLLAAVKVLVQLVRRRVQLPAHERPLVVDQAGVETGDKGAWQVQRRVSHDCCREQLCT